VAYKERFPFEPEKRAIGRSVALRRHHKSEGAVFWPLSQTIEKRELPSCVSCLSKTIQRIGILRVFCLNGRGMKLAKSKVQCVRFRCLKHRYRRRMSSCSISRCPRWMARRRRSQFAVGTSLRSCRCWPTVTLPIVLKSRVSSPDPLMSEFGAGQPVVLLSPTLRVVERPRNYWARCAVRPCHAATVLISSSHCSALRQSP
jgi:hypothetical protein